MPVTGENGNGPPSQVNSFRDRKWPICTVFCSAGGLTRYSALRNNGEPAVSLDPGSSVSTPMQSIVTMEAKVG